jgi:hypothetical protein
MMKACLSRLVAIVAWTLLVAATARAQWQPPPYESYIRRLPETGHSPLSAAQLDPSLPAASVPELIVDEAPKKPAPKAWEGSFELGLAGTQGSAETFNFRFGSDLKNKRPGSTLTLDLDYKRDTAGGLETANQLFFEGRHEWEREASSWNIFAHTSYEYDEFKGYDYLVAIDGGISHVFADSDVNKLKGRTGAGASREVGGPNDATTPELLFGLDFERKVSEWQKFKASTDYYPSLENLAEFRLTARVDWELLLDANSNLSLKIGIIDRYDTSPSNPTNNSLDYSTVILWKF